MPTATQRARHNTPTTNGSTNTGSAQPADSANSSAATVLNGLVLDEVLGSVSGRGRRANPIDSQVAADLDTSLRAGKDRGVIHFTGTPAQVRARKAQISKWIKSQPENSVTVPVYTVEGTLGSKIKDKKSGQVKVTLPTEKVHVKYSANPLAQVIAK